MNCRKISRRAFGLICRERIAPNPRRLGKALHGRLRGLWSYRIGDHRVVARIEDEKVTVVVINVSHRKDVYDT